MAQKIPGGRRRKNRVPIYFNDTEFALLEKLVRHYIKRSKEQLLSLPLVDRASIIRYMVIKAAMNLPKEAK